MACLKCLVQPHRRTLPRDERPNSIQNRRKCQSGPGMLAGAWANHHLQAIELRKFNAHPGFRRRFRSRRLATAKDGTRRLAAIVKDCLVELELFALHGRRLGRPRGR